MLDAGAQANLVIGQRAIFGLHPDIRSRLNALYLAVSFLGGACGSALSGYAVVHGGAKTMSLFGLGFAMIAALVFVLHARTLKQV